MHTLKKYTPGIMLCLTIAIPAWFLGQKFPVIGGPVIAIVAGMIAAPILKHRALFQSGITFSSKKILQYAVILLGFGMDLTIVLQTGRQSLPIIVLTILTALTIAYILHKAWAIPSKISTLVGVGSAICGGSAIAATAPIINADDEEVAQAISVIFFFNVLAAMIFPSLGAALGLSTTSGEAFGVFAGTAVNDTSSVTAAASTWDTLYHLGSATLDKAVTVKLTRTLAIIPIAAFLAFFQAEHIKKSGTKLSLKKIFPFFILWFIAASVLTTILTEAGFSSSIFLPFKFLSKFLIVTAMAAIGLNTHITKLIKTAGKPMLMGFCCWIGITLTSLVIQFLLGIW